MRNTSPQHAAKAAQELDEPTAAVEPDNDTNPSDGGRRKRTGALDRAVQILDRIQEVNAPMTAYEVARSVGAPLTTVYTIINDLVDKRLLTRNREGSVWLGPRLYGYGLTYVGSLDFMEVAADEMRRLAEEVEETVQLCGCDEGMMVVLDMKEGPGHFKVTSKVGSRVPLNWTASGRLLVGHMPRKELERFFARHALPSPTGRAVTDPVQLAEMAHVALAQRLAQQIGESEVAVACLASPILNRDSQCALVISLVLPEQKALQRYDFYASAVKAAARRIEERLGW
ncbi:IclR family transcriptional regulator [Trinickia dinghuensis]|uniref:IclR family transcriptional regulator n=1 Tax=Trinickia dinghuensis TaxID=2291023 RepID=A0A3D8K4Q5_9BURK|nr:IclR family transcriptional regulator [Trinickia dinghuensis]RDU99844.1 IclR family transcriptional regulator [Trinickia dinghuensis]